MRTGNEEITNSAPCYLCRFGSIFARSVKRTLFFVLIKAHLEAYLDIEKKKERKKEEMQ